MHQPPPNPGVRVPPPLLFVAGFLLAWLADARLVHLPVDAGAGARSVAHGAVQGAGASLIVAGVALVFWGILTFARARTAILPHRPAARLVTTGPYRFTRNPMYTGFATAYAGAALVANTAWPLIVLPVVVRVVYVLVIRREEQYLAGAFGAEFDAYRARVRRWGWW